MNAGRLRHRVTLQRATDTASTTTGAAVPSWADLGNWWCEIKPVGGREGLIDGGVRAEADVRLIGRRNTVVMGLKPSDRAVSADGLTLYNIAGFPESTNDNASVTLRARVGLNDGR